MKKYAVILWALVVSGALYAADAAMPTTVDVPTKTDWIAAVSRIAIDLLPILGVVLAALATWAVHKLAAKLHLDKVAGAEELLQSAVGKGVQFAEAWAAKQSQKPVGNEKLEMALKTVEAIVGTPMVQQAGREKLVALVEATLQQDINGDGKIG